MSTDPKRPKGCENCQKPCKIHLTQIVDGKIIKVDMCDSCPHAKELEEPKELGLVQSLIVQMLNSGNGEEMLRIVCPKCGFTLEDFKKRSRLGCPDCYDVFMPVLEEHLGNMHRGLHHVGKRPKKASESNEKLQTEIMDLTKKLDEAVVAERYEEAARLRDQIKDVKSRMENQDSQSK